MRADFGLMLLHEPDILFLDEPTLGLDVLTKKNILRFLKCVNAECRTTIMMTSRNMYDLEQLATRLILIDKGRIFFDGDPVSGQKGMIQMKIYRIFRIVILLYCILVLPGCYSATHQHADVLSPQAVLANKDVLLNRTIVVRGTAMPSLRVLCTLMACPAENPCCNMCAADLQLCEAGTCITLSGNEADIQVGCSGNECGLSCFPFQQGTVHQVSGVWRKRAYEEYVLELRSASQKSLF
jgi:hypothetical protein